MSKEAERFKKQLDELEQRRQSDDWQNSLYWLDDASEDIRKTTVQAFALALFLCSLLVFFYFVLFY